MPGPRYSLRPETIQKLNAGETVTVSTYHNRKGILKYSKPVYSF